MTVREKFPVTQIKKLLHITNLTYQAINELHSKQDIEIQHTLSVEMCYEFCKGPTQVMEHEFHDPKTPNTNEQFADKPHNDTSYIK